MRKMFAALHRIAQISLHLTGVKFTFDAMKPEELKKLLEEKGTKHIWLAEKLGVNRALISMWLSGRAPIPEKHVPTIHKLLD